MYSRKYLVNCVVVNVCQLQLCGFKQRNSTPINSDVTFFTALLMDSFTTVTEVNIAILNLVQLPFMTNKK